MKGFTLIELLVVAAISALIFGFGFAGYRTFVQRRAVRLASNSLYSQLVLLRSQARNGLKNRNCDELLGYEVKWQSPDLFVRQKCKSWQQSWQEITNHWSVGQVQIVFNDGDDNSLFTFEPLSGQLKDISWDPAVFQLQTASKCRQIQLYQNGNILLKSC